MCRLRWYLAGFVLFFLLNSPAFAQALSQAPLERTPNISPSLQSAAHDPLQTCVPSQQAGEKELFQKRLEEYLQARNESPQNAEVHYNLGLIYSRLQQWEEAQKSFFQALSYDQDKERIVRIYHQLGNVYACQRQFENAIALYKQTLRMDPLDADTQHNLALSQLLAQQQQQQQQQSQGKTDENREKNESQQSPSPPQEQPQSERDRPHTERPPEEENSQQIHERDSQQEPDTQQDKQTGNKDSSEEQSPQFEEGSSGKEEEDTMQAALTRRQAEQLLNSIPEDRRQFIQRLLDRQTQVPPPSDKSW